MAVKAEQVAMFMVENMESMTEEMGSPQGWLAAGTGITGGLAMMAGVNEVRINMNHAETSTLVGTPAEAPAGASGVELAGAAITGFGLASAVTYFGIKKWALRHISREDYKNAKTYMLGCRE